MTFPVVVVGAGLAGLNAAIHLADGGVPPLVLEADTQWAGGRLSGGEDDTFTHKGREWSFASQHGIHAVWGGYDNMRAMLDRFIDIKLLPSQGEEWINRWGREVRAIEAGTAVRYAWLPAPMHYLQLLLRPRFWATITPLDFLSMPGMLISLAWAMGLDPIEEKIALDGLMIDEFFRGWTPNLKATMLGLAHSLLAAPTEAITLTGFIAAMRFYTFTRRDVWHLDYLPSNPHGCLIQPMIDYIHAKEGEVKHGSRLRKLTKTADGWDLQVEDANQAMTRTISAKHIILAVPPNAAQKILTDSIDTQAEAEKLIFPSTLRNSTVRLWFDAPPRKGAPGGMFTGDFMLDNFFWLHRIQTEFHEWEAVTGGSAIEAHLYATDDLLKKPSELLIIEATKEVQAAFPELRGHFVHGTVRRNSKTQTAFRVPTDESLHVQTPWDGIFACGDWIGYPHASFWMERCTVTGIAAANAVLQQYDKPAFDIIPVREPEGLAKFIGGVVKLGRRTLGRGILSAARRVKK